MRGVLKLKSTLFIKSAKILGAVEVQRAIISTSKGAESDLCPGSCRDAERSAACEQKCRTDETRESVPAPSQTPCPACPFMQFMATCVARSSHPYAVWLFAGTTVPAAGNNEQQKWRLPLAGAGQES